jgi:hypothetical protein
MDNVKQLFQDIKNVFKTEGVNVETEETTTEPTPEPTETVEEKFEDVTLADGSIAQVEPDVSLGAAMVLLIDDALQPAPTGDYELADGRVVSVEDGVIVAVAEPELEEIEEAPAEEVVEEEVMENDKPFTDEQRREAKKIIESIVTEKHFASEKETNKINADIVALKEAFKSLVEITEQIASDPATKTAKKSNSGFSHLKKNKRDVISYLKDKKIIN